MLLYLVRREDNSSLHSRGHIIICDQNKLVKKFQRATTTFNNNNIQQQKTPTVMMYKKIINVKSSPLKGDLTTVL